MTDGQKRWEEGAEGIRRGAPAWLNLDRLPWWGWAVMGLAWTCWGVYLLLTADGPQDVVTALGLLLLVAPSQLLMAQRRRRGLPMLGNGR